MTKQTVKTTGLVSNIDMGNRVYTIRNQRVMLDRDLAVLFDTEARKINQQYKRNLPRFGEEYAFQLDQQEFGSF
ncbi:ORF6N domain-containing protein [bacterium]|nr:ORF6N domain-containing protein [bacterium]